MRVEIVEGLLGWVESSVAENEKSVGVGLKLWISKVHRCENVETISKYRISGEVDCGESGTCRTFPWRHSRGGAQECLLDLHLIKTSDVLHLLPVGVQGGDDGGVVV